MSDVFRRQQEHNQPCVTRARKGGSGSNTRCRVWFSGQEDRVYGMSSQTVRRIGRLDKLARHAYECLPSSAYFRGLKVEGVCIS